MSHYVLVCGGRDFNDYPRAREPIRILAVLHGQDLRVMHGGARGADMLAEEIAIEFGIKTKAFPADWNTHGKAAGPIRNVQMADYLDMCRSKGHTVEVMAFPGGKGTAHMVSTATERNIVVNQM